MSEAPANLSRRIRPGLFRFSMAGFLGCLLVMLIAEPLIVNLKNASLVEALLLTLVLLAAVQAVGHSHRVLLWAAVLSAPAVIGRWCFEISQQRMMPEIHLATGLLFILFIIVQLLRHILRAPRVDSEVLCAGIATYLMLGLLWSFAFKLVDWRTNGAFALQGVPDVNHALNHGFTSLYFSLITLTTVGYGDVTPVSDVARMLASLEALTGTLFVAVLISRLVAVYSRSAPEIENEMPTGN